MCPLKKLGKANIVRHAPSVMPCLTSLDPSNTAIRRSCSVLFRGLVPFVDTILFRLYNQTYEEINMDTKQYEISVIGTVERTVIVSGASLEEAQSNAETEWSALTGGYITTAEIVEAHEVDTDGDA